VSTMQRLYRGETNFGFVEHRKRWYTLSAVLMVVCVLSIGLRGFNFGIDFKGGNSLQFPTGQATISQVQTAVTDSGVPTESIQQAGSGSSAQFVVKTSILPQARINTLENAIASSLGPKIPINGKPMAANDISVSQVSASWGRDVTDKALVALIVFLVAVTVFISAFFEWRLSVGAIVGVLHDLVLSAGIYSLIGFEVTPSTVVGLLTILGYSLYDNIVVYDKVRENTRGILGSTKQTYSEAANKAVNQTLARSINTSLIALLPVAGLLFVGAGLLGVGTIKDLALVLFVGLATGAYSSLFLATPIACDLKERQPQFKALAKRVAARRASAAAKAEAAARSGGEGGAGTTTAVLAPAAGPSPGVDDPTPGEAPRPGARPQSKRRPQQKRGGRPQQKRRR
jgi:preprotein translocase subunit SecF